MANPRGRGSASVLSVVIPAHNSSSWLPSTIEALALALARTSWNAEIIVVDDGSTDDSLATLESLRSSLKYPLRVISQENQGTFIAVWEGVRNAASDEVFILNSRLLVHEHAFAYVRDNRKDGEPTQPWNGHVVTDPAAPLIGQFWSVPTYVFWGEYLARPRPMVITPENFDRVPKGTGFFLVDKLLFEEACRVAWPEGDAALTSDDTKLLRFIAEKSPIRLEPGFSGTYRPRANLRGFLSHAWHRGTLFVDSYAGTGRGRNAVLVALAVLPLLAVPLIVTLAVLGQWWAIGIGVALLAVALLVPLVIAAARRCPRRALVSYLLLVVPFGFAFTAGLLRGVVVHRRLLSRNGRASQDAGVTP